MDRGPWWGTVHGITKKSDMAEQLTHTHTQRDKTWLDNQFSSVSQSCLTLCDPMDCSTPGFVVRHQLPELIQTHVHQVGDATQPSYPLLPLLLPSSIFPSIRVFSNESVLCITWPKYWSSASASVLPVIFQDSFPLGWTGWISLQSKGLSRIFSNTTVQKHQFFSAQLYSPTLTFIHDYWKNHTLD